MYTLTVFFSSSVTDRTDRTMVLARRGETVADSTIRLDMPASVLVPQSSCPQACQRGFPSLSVGQHARMNRSLDLILRIQAYILQRKIRTAA